MLESEILASIVSLGKGLYGDTFSITKKVDYETEDNERGYDEWVLSLKGHTISEYPDIRSFVESILILGIDSLININRL